MYPDLRARAVNYFPACLKTHTLDLRKIYNCRQHPAHPPPWRIRLHLHHRCIYVQIRGHISGHMHIQMVWLESYTLGDKTMSASNLSVKAQRMGGEKKRAQIKNVGAGAGSVFGPLLLGV